MAATDLAVRIATILDSTGLKKADKGFSKLEKQAKSLGKSLGLALSTAAVVAYGRASVKAFAEDEAAAARLSTAIDNLGLSFSKVQAADFIANLEKSAGIADDVLRPAFQALLTTTGSLTKSQELLNNAIQISRASGVELGTVAQDLAKGYVGVTKGLQKYNTGLTKSELQTKSFSDVLGILLTRSAGAADAYLETTSYKLDVLRVAAGNAQEVIGEGLVNAFAKAGGGTSAQDAAKTFDNIAKAINGITNAAGTAIGAVVKLYQKFDSATKKFSENYPDPFGLRDDAPMKAGRSSSPAGTAKRMAQQKAAEAAAAKRAKEIAALNKKQVAATKALTAEQKKQALAKKQSALFDLEQIGIIAALKGNISEEERLRLNLQLALLTGNTKEADTLSQKLANSIDSTGKLAKSLRELPDANNPFKSWDAFLDTIIAKARLAASIGAGGSESRGATFAALNPTVQDLVTGSSGTARAGVTSGGDVYVTVNGSVVSDQDLVIAIENGLQGRSLSGSNSVIGRIQGMFG